MNRKHRLIRLILLLFVILVTIYYYPLSPSRIPIHWSIEGEVDGYGSKIFGLFLVPGILILMSILFYYIPAIDPKKKNYKLFDKEWEIIKTLLIAFFAFIQFIILYSSMDKGVSVSKLMIGGFGIFFIILGKYLGKVKQNFFLGIRTPWTLSSKDNWNKTHKFGGWCFVGSGLILVVGSLVGMSPAVLFITLITSAFLPIGYSLYLYKKN